MKHLPNNTDILFSYWDNIPSIKIIDEETETKILKQDFRENIIELLSSGVNETNPNTQKNEIRYVLSAKEIMRLLEKKLRMSIKYPGLYFHLAKLEENEIVTEVTQVKIKKNNVSYYGLTARNFISKTQLIESRNIWMKDRTNYQKEIMSALKQISSSITETEIELVIQEFIEINKEIPDGFEEWISSLVKTAKMNEQLILFLIDLFRYANLEISKLKAFFEKINA